MNMKKNNLSFWLVAVLCVLNVISSCKKEDSTTSLSSYVDINITRCERVGERIVVEFDMKNKSGNVISSIAISPSSLIDNSGKEYSTFDNIGMRVKGALNRPYEVGPISLQKDEVKQLEVVAAGFDVNNTATGVNLVVTGRIKDVDLEKNTIKASAKIVDNRVLDNGIQTNDAGIEWTLKSCKREGDYLYVAYDMKNNTGSLLKNVSFLEANYMTKGFTFVAQDDLGQTYRNLYHAENNESYSFALTFDIANNETKTIITRIADFDRTGNATKISICNELKCESYLFSDPIVRLINIPIE